MKTFCVCIQNILLFFSFLLTFQPIPCFFCIGCIFRQIIRFIFWLFCLFWHNLCLSVLSSSPSSIFIQPTFPVCIIDPNSRLHVITINMKTNPCTFILHRKSLNPHTGRHQIIPLKIWCDPVKDMVSSIFHIICHFIFPRQHSFNIQIPSPCDQIFLVGIFSCQLKSNQMTTIIKVLICNHIVFHSMPSRRPHITNLASFCSWHKLLTNISKGNLTTA